MLYDTSRAGNLSNDWFEPHYWQSRGELQGAARGRGAAYFVRHDSKSWVLRHYRRGGLMAHLFADRYHWRNEESTRPFAEWQLTYRLHRAGLPVPAPVAARYRNRGSSYTGDIITERLPTVGSLTECLRAGALSVVTWISIGRCIRRFHDLGVCHADLNAHNLLLSEESVYLIDFDRCQLRTPGHVVRRQSRAAAALTGEGHLGHAARALHRIGLARTSRRLSPVVGQDRTAALAAQAGSCACSIFSPSISPLR